ncbi:protease inhibitor I42 family protein [Glycomyces paridis]|uniref:Proteinase inhibitor I42 chagasin domain-containing protein n=1 Tax=Glycomyces paridis TaxID=2126555 RepID=A0A4S8P0N6_9ACTN|nr:protease inhibitor I42 family protein [Glycomyces paridis]THV23557.1 hypothetical protein E9998_22425 [Glycomyces paridis]
MRALAPIPALLLLVLAGCSGADETVALDAETATVAVGETLRVDLGTVNASVGDNWYLVSGADTGVIAEGDKRTDGDDDCDGCSGELSWDFEALEAGETTLVFQYCFRTSLAECTGDASDGPPPEPVELAVTVTG